MKKHIYATILLIVLTFFAKAQRYPFYNLSVEEGLIQSQVNTLTQDAKGHLWIGTLGGVSRYDGSNFTHYTVRKGMLSNEVQTIVTDKKGNVWLGGPKGLSKYDGKSFKHFLFEAPENNNANQLRSIKIAEDNTLWCYTDTKVYQVAGDSTIKLDLPNDDIVITSILPLKDTLLIGTNNGIVYRHYNNSWDSLYYTVPNFDKPPILTTGFYQDSKKHTYVLSRSGLFQLKNDSIKVVKADKGYLYNIPFISIAEDKDGAIWLGSMGAYKLHDGKIEKYSRDNGFTDNRVTSILTDKEGNVWFGCDGQGIYRYSGKQLSIIDNNTDLPSEQILSIAATPNGRVYLGTYTDGLFSYYNDKITRVPLKYNKIYITALVANGEHDLWLGTNGLGLWRVNGTQRKYYNKPQLPSNRIISLYNDTIAGTTWIGTDAGVAVYNMGEFSFIDDLKTLIVSFVSIGIDSMVIATNNGIYLHSDGHTRPFITNAIKDVSNPQCLTYQNGKLWVGTRDNGLVCYDLNTEKYFILNNDNGLHSDFIYNIIIDNYNDIWIGTGFGIHKVHMNNSTPEITFFGKEQGITGMESNHNAIAKTNDGTLWFGTMKGVVHIDPSTDLLQPIPTSVVLQSIKLFGNEISDTTYYDSLDKWYNVPYQLSLPYKKNNVTFTFRGISLAGAKQLKYRYKMNGLDAPWSDWTALNSITYSSLQPGNYTLNIECKTPNTDEVKNLAYSFEIITPLHKTSWFRFAIFIACILLGISIQYTLNRRKQNRAELVQKLRGEEQAKVRQRTAEDFHDELGNKLTRINILTNVLRNKISNLGSEEKRIIDQIQDNTGQLYSGTKDILWSLQPTNDNLYEILNRVKEFGIDLFEDTNIEFQLKGLNDQWNKYRLPLDKSRNFIMIFKEALNNILKYADASEVVLETTLKEGNILHIMLKDNGKGFNVEEVVKGNGLNNMRNRTERLNGKIYIDSKDGRGTTINLHFQLPKKTKQQR